MAPPPASDPFAPPRPVDLLTPPWLLPPPTPPETLDLVAPKGSLVPPPPPWSVVTLLTPRTYKPSTTLSLSTPTATAGSSFPPALPQSSGTLAPPQSLRLLLGLQCRRHHSIPSALCLLPGIHWLPLRRSSPGHRQPQLHHGSSLPWLRCGLSSLLCSGSVSSSIIAAGVSSSITIPSPSPCVEQHIGPVLLC